MNGIALLEAAAPYGAGGLMLAAMVVLRGILADRDKSLALELASLRDAIGRLSDKL